MKRKKKNTYKKCKHDPVFGYDLSLIIICAKCKKELPCTPKNLRKAKING